MPDARFERLHDWLATALPAWPRHRGQWRAERIAGGQSNPSWRLSADDGRAWVLRAKPGPAAALLPSAHAIEREYQVLRALAGSAVPVPPAVVLCEDEAVFGAAFYVMRYVEGRIFRDPALPGLAPEARAEAFADAARVLAALHALDPAACGLGDFGRGDAFFERLVARWTRQYQASLGAPIAPAGARAMQQLADWLPAHIPASARAAPAVLTHGDYRLENLMFAPDAPRVVAVLDWELATLGHPWADLGYHAMAWWLPEGVLRGLAGLPAAVPGLPTAAQQVQRYFAAAGAPADAGATWDTWRADAPFYLAVNLFRLAAILQGIAQRAHDGIAAHPQADSIARMAAPVAELGWAVATGRQRAF